MIDIDGNPQTLTDYWATDNTKPKPFVPFAVPMRLTNNARCPGSGGGRGDLPYCGSDALAFGLKAQCVDTASIPTGQNNQLTPVCISEDGLPNVANTAATRPRPALQPRLNEAGETVGAWVVVVAEESKGMGRFFFLAEGEQSPRAPNRNSNHSSSASASPMSSTPRRAKRAIRIARWRTRARTSGTSRR